MNALAPLPHRGALHITPFINIAGERLVRLQVYAADGRQLGSISSGRVPRQLSALALATQWADQLIVADMVDHGRPAYAVSGERG